MFWVNPNLPYIVDGQITEYDIKSGNVSIMRTFRDKFTPPLQEDAIQQIASLDKKARVVRVGTMMRDIPGFSKTLETGFNTVVEDFCILNHLDVKETSEDIVSIKRDAVFVVNKPVEITTIREYCHFIPKNTYDGYFRIKGFEFYIRYGDRVVDVKGIDDAKLPLHQDGILELILDVYGEFRNGLNRVKVSKWMADYVDAYLSKELPFEMYRRFDNESKYAIRYGDREYLTESIDEEDMQDLDIEFNYRKIIIPLLNLLL